jgi:hypothetical protein
MVAVLVWVCSHALLAATRSLRACRSRLHPAALTQKPPDRPNPINPPQEAVEVINSAYPEEIVRYYSPAYSRQLLEKLDAAAGAAVQAAA